MENDLSLITILNAEFLNRVSSNDINGVKEFINFKFNYYPISQKQIDKGIIT